MKLRNTYYALRHGTSEANERGIVVSHPENGIRGWGLTVAGAAGCRQRLDPAELHDPRLDPARTVVVSSDFSRARETAAILCELHALAPFEIDIALRERFFGDLEMGRVQRYDEVWDRDAHGPNHGHVGAESTEWVARRMAGVIERQERRHTEMTVVLVSHGDPLQILETVLLGLPSHRHRERAHLGNAEMRRLSPR
jgi:probable phosphoglycerate mutase